MSFSSRPSPASLGRMANEAKLTLQQYWIGNAMKWGKNVLGSAFFLNFFFLASKYVFFVFYCNTNIIMRIVQFVEY